MGKRRAVRAGRLPRPLRGGGDDPVTANAMRLAALAKQPPKRSARPPHPDAPTVAYARQLERIATESYRYALPLIAELRRLQALADAARQDLDDQPPPDEPPEQARAAEQNRPHKPSEKGPAQLPLPFTVRREVEIMRRQLTIYRHNLPTEGIAAKAADQLEKWRIHVDQRILSDLGLQPVKAGTELAAARDAWVRDNAALISSQPAEVAARIEATVAEMVPGGARWETIAAKLEQEHGIATNRANLIARDQVSKYNADLNRIQQQAAGIDFFQWRGAMDNRERPAHVALEGTVWRWSQPPIIGAPGEAIQCRCVAVPCVSDQLISRAGEMTEADLLDRTAALGPTQKQGEGATAAEVRERAAKEIANEIKLARRRQEVVGRPTPAQGQKAP